MSNFDEAIKLHLNVNSSKDILRGDLLILEQLYNEDYTNEDNLLKLKEDYLQTLYSNVEEKEILQISPKDEDIYFNKFIDSIKSEFIKNEIYRLNSGSKKSLRKNIFIKVCNIDHEIKLYLANYIEIVHLVSLIQDDIIDKATKRRHKDTLNYLYSDKQALLISDIILIESSTYLLEVLRKYQEENDIKDYKEDIELLKDKLFNILKNMVNSELVSKQNIDYDKYLENIKHKTANLFGIIMYGAKLLYCIDSKEEVMDLDNYYDLGIKYGVCFQKVDDYIDCYHKNQDSGKDGNDLKTNVKNYLSFKSKEEAIKEINKEIEYLLAQDELVCIRKEIDYLGENI